MSVTKMGLGVRTEKLGSRPNSILQRQINDWKAVVVIAGGGEVDSLS